MPRGVGYAYSVASVVDPLAQGDVDVQLEIFKFKTHEDDYLSITRMIICSALSSQVVWLLPFG